MMEFLVKKSMDKFKKEMSEVSGKKLHEIVSRSINHTAGKVNTQLNRNIRNVYKISLSDLNDTKQKLTVKSSSSSLSAFIFANKVPLSLSKFNPVQFNAGVKTSFKGSKKTGGFVSQKTKSKSSGVQIEVVKGKKEIIPSAFLLFAKSSKAAVFARGVYGGESFVFGKDRLPITHLNTKSVYYAIGDRTVTGGIPELIHESMYQRMLHEIRRTG